MGIVSYNSKKLIPAGFLSISKEYLEADDGTKIGSVFNINYLGKTLAYKGSPMSDGTFWDQSGYPPDETPDANQHLRNLLRKQEAIRDLFSTDGHSFEVQSDDGSTPMKFNPRVKSVNFSDGLWYNIYDYNIQLEADLIYGGSFIAPSGEDQFAYLISTAKDTWQLEFDDRAESVELPNTFRLSHSVEAKGKRFFDENGDLIRQAWENGKLWVQSRIGFDATQVSGVGVINNPSFLTGRNHVRSETIDELGGLYAVEENWIISSGNALEDFNVTVKTSNQIGTTSVSIDGTITGLETRNSDYQITETKWAAASGRFDYVNSQLISRAQAYSGKSLNVKPLSYTVGKNPITGVITYSVEYDNRKSNCIPGALYENITIVDLLPTDIYASIGILGRTAGPILQPIHTTRETSRQLSIEVVMEQSGATDCSLASLINLYNSQRPSMAPNTSGVLYNLIYAASPVNFNGVTQVFVKDDTETWNPIERRYSRNVEWAYQ